MSWKGINFDWKELCSYIDYFDDEDSSLVLANKIILVKQNENKHGNAKVYNNLVKKHTLLQSISSAVKCLPNSLGASPGTASILTQTSWPVTALSSCLWLASMPVANPIKTFYE